MTEVIQTEGLSTVPSNSKPFSSLPVVGLKENVQAEVQLESSEVAQHFEPLRVSTASFLQTLEHWRVQTDFTAVPLPDSVAVACTLVAEYLKAHEVGLSAAQDGFSFASSGVSYAEAITPDIDQSEREKYLSHMERIAAQGRAKSGEALDSLRMLRRKLNQSLDAMRSSSDSPSAHAAKMNTPHNEILVLESNLSLLLKFEQCMDWHISWWSRTSMKSIHQESTVKMYSQDGGELRRRGVLLQWTNLRDTYSEYTNKMQKLQDQYTGVFHFTLDPKILIDIPTASNPAPVPVLQEDKEETSHKRKEKRDSNVKINSPLLLPSQDAFQRAEISKPNRRQEELGKNIHPVASAPLNLQATNNTTRSGNGTSTTKTGDVGRGDYISAPIADLETPSTSKFNRRREDSGKDIHSVASSALLNLQATNNTTRSGNGTTNTKTSNGGGGDYISDTPIDPKTVINPNSRQEEVGKDIHPVAPVPLNLQVTNNTTHSGNRTTTTKTGNIGRGDDISGTPIADRGTGHADLLQRSSQPDLHEKDSGHDVPVGGMTSPPKVSSRISPAKHVSLSKSGLPTSDPKQEKHESKLLESDQLTHTKSGGNDHISAPASSPKNEKPSLLSKGSSEGIAQPDSQVKRGNTSSTPPSNREKPAAPKDIPSTPPSPRIPKQSSRTDSRSLRDETSAPENPNGGVGLADVSGSSTTNMTPTNDGHMKSDKSHNDKGVDPSPPEVDTSKCCCVIM